MPAPASRGWIVRPLVVSFALLCALVRPALAQEIHYLYDELNRLIGVVDQQGNAAEYVYDAVGNILQIKRFDVGPTASVSITLVSPSKGSVGTTVQIFGKGFSSTATQNTVTFSGGATAPVTPGTSTSLTTSVPAGATTGPLTLTTPLGSATSPEPFTVLQGVAVVPDQATVLLGKSYGFQAALDGTPTSAVTWRVNGIVGGTATLGTISPTGLYTAPTTPPPLQPVPIEAVLAADPTRVAVAQVTLLPWTAGGSTGARLSVGPAQPSATANPLSALRLSVSPVPVISGVTPGSGARGSSVTVTLTGVGLADPTGLAVLRGNIADPLIAVSGLAAAPDGTSLTATLTIDPTAPLGARILQVTAGGRTSPALGTGSNAFSVQ